jgi:integrase
VRRFLPRFVAEQRVCERCARPYMARAEHQRYCSSRCRYRARYRDERALYANARHRGTRQAWAPRVATGRVRCARGAACSRAELVDEVAAELSPSHARKALVALRVALRLCEDYGDVDANPCAGVRAPEGDGEERPARVLTLAELDLLLAAAEADDARFGRSFAGPFVALAAGTGLRLGELLALPWGADGLDLEAGVARVRRSLDGHRDEHGVYSFVAPKSRASRRDVPLSAGLARRMRLHRLATGRPDDGELVFPGDHGRPVAPHGLPRAAWRRLVHGTGSTPPVVELEPRPRFHDLRHSYATHMLAAGVSAHAVSELLGHGDAGLVWQRYGHAMPGEVAAAGDALEAWKMAQNRHNAAAAGGNPLQIGT